MTNDMTMRALRAMTITDAHDYMMRAYASCINDDLREIDCTIEMIESHDDAVIIDARFIRAHIIESNNALMHYALIASYDDAMRIDHSRASCIICKAHDHCIACESIDRMN